MNRKYFLPLFLFVQIVFLKIISLFPEFVERFYSNGLYLVLSHFLRFTFGKSSFSVGDCIYFVIIFFAIKWIWVKKKSWKPDWKNNLLQIVSFFSIVYFLFNLLWAFNYYRQPLFEKMKINTEYSDADLLTFTQKIIAKTNAVQYQIAKNKNQKIVFPYTQEQTFVMNLEGYQKLSDDYTFFNYSNLSVKKSIISLPLTYMGFSGYLNPFTNEAQVNDMIPMYQFPVTTCHEMAHQLGYASESDCNFIGFLATVNTDNLYFQYSGYSMALRYCLANWYNRNPKIEQQLLQAINPGILKNYQESEDFWQQYETPIETGFHIFYDHYLKMNQQKDGMESYNKFVDLMVNYYKGKEI